MARSSSEVNGSSSSSTEGSCIKGARDRQPLPHATRKFADQPVFDAAEVHVGREVDRRGIRHRSSRKS